MKLFNAIATATATVISATFIAAGPTEARNGWVRIGCNHQGECQYAKVLKRNYPYVVFLNNGREGPFKKEADCGRYKYRFLNDDGSKTGWIPAMPGSIGEDMIRSVCG